MVNREYFRFLWSHQAYLHRLAVKIFNRIMRLVPFSIKYGLGKRWSRNKPPYSLVRDGSIVVQIGAPMDTLHSGRSRGVYFSLLAGPKCKVVIIEPDVASIEELKSVTRKHGVTNVILCPFAAWSEKKQAFKLFVNDSHPATNFSEGTVDYSQRRLQDFRVVEIPADTVDSILAGIGIERVELVSITTNGAEREILKGMKGTIAAGLPFICLARTGSNYEEMMAELGYKFFAHDDRGYIFKQHER